MRARRFRSALPLLSVLLGVIVGPVPSARALDPARPVAQLSHRFWQDQLPQTTVHSIVQSRDGYLWLATYDGLVRFDGVRFVIFDRTTKPGLPGASVLALHEDRRGRLWAATNAGVALFDGGTEKIFTTRDGLASDSALAVGELADGSVWIGTAGGLSVREGSGFRKVELPGGLRSPVRGIDEEPGGIRWYCTDAGLLRVDRSGAAGDIGSEAMATDPCRALVRSRDGSLWVASGSGLAHRVDGRWTRFEARDGLPGSQVRTLLEDRDGSLWLGTQDAGVARFARGRFEVFGARQGLSHNLVRSLFQDREGNLWVGTNAGIDQLREARVTALTTRGGLTNDFVRTILEDRNGVVWIGTDGGGANRWADGELSAVGTADGLVNASVRSLAEGPDGTLWFGTRGGLSLLKEGRFRSITESDGLAANVVRSILVDPDGSAWVGTEGRGLDRIEGGSIRHVELPEGIRDDDVRALFRDSSKRIWAATFRGICLYDGDRPPVRLRRADGLPSDNVFCFHEDERGSIWIGTDSGLARYRDGRFAVVDVSAGLIDNRVYWILSDGNGNLWTSSSRGVARLSLRSLDDVLEKRSSKVEVEGLDTSHGMPTNHCNGVSQPAGWRTRAGRLWFPTTAGAVEIDPAHWVRNGVAPAVNIESISVDGERSIAGNLARIGPGRHNVEIDYAATSFSAPERVRFRYRLDGFDADWIDAGSRRVAYYTRLPPGRFVFRVIACNNDGVWNESGARLDIEVLPSSLESWWAQILFALLVAALAFAIHRLALRSLARRNRQLEEKVAARTAELDRKVQQLVVSERQAHEAEMRATEANRIKSSFLSAMSHELRTPLNSIIGFSTILREKAGPSLEPRHAKFLANIQGSGQHLLQLINDLLDLSKIEAGRMELALEPVDVPAIVDAVCRLIQGMSEERGVTLEKEIDDRIPQIVADPVRLRQILFNLLSNAIKFSERGQAVTIRAGLVPAVDSPLASPSLRLDVVDRGTGIAPEHRSLIFEEFRQVRISDPGRQGTGLGLPLVRRLLALHGGTITVDSTPGLGSTFSAFLPLERAATPEERGEPEPPAIAAEEAPPRQRPRFVPALPILVVEDDAAAARQLASLLEAEGYVVALAKNGEEALARLADQLPALVVLDLLLPGLDGWAVLRAIREMPGDRRVPVIIVTRHPEAGAARALGADEIFLKPVKRADLLARVEALVRQSGRERPTGRVLLVDDDPAVHELVGPALEGAGYSVVAARDGREGLDLARSLLPDLVVLDLVMPELSGFEVSAALRGDPETSRIPIVILTAAEPGPSEREQLSGAIEALLEKEPVVGPRLVETIRRVLAATPRPRSPGTEATH